MLKQKKPNPLPTLTALNIIDDKNICCYINKQNERQLKSNNTDVVI